MGNLAMSGEGKIPPAKKGAGFSFAGGELNLAEPKGEAFCFSKVIFRLPAVAWRNSRNAS